MQTYQTEKRGLVKAWVDGVPFEDAARAQVARVAEMPFIHKHVAVLPDVHYGKGATVGSVIATKGAIIPAAVGVDLGCGMTAVRTTLKASDLPDTLAPLRSAIEAAVPHGRTDNGGANDRGAWGEAPAVIAAMWRDGAQPGQRTVEVDGAPGDSLMARFHFLCLKHPKLERSNSARHLGTLGGGNHFIEICLDTEQNVWVMLHSGSRGVGGRIGSYFIELAKQEMQRWFINLPDKDLSYLPEGSQYFEDYCEAVSWAQDFAAANRLLMRRAVCEALVNVVKPFALVDEAISCHHNYVSRERHFGEDVIVTRKGAVSAREGELGIIPGSMGAKSFIVRGKGNRDSFCSCSHGAGRSMSRTEAKKRFTVEDHKAAVAGVECRTDAEVVDETPAAYKSIDAVMAAQTDLVDVVATLKQVLCVKG